jgi:hypothetical protein
MQYQEARKLSDVKQEVKRCETRKLSDAMGTLQEAKRCDGNASGS